MTCVVTSSGRVLCLRSCHDSSTKLVDAVVDGNVTLVVSRLRPSRASVHLDLRSVTLSLSYLCRYRVPMKAAGHCRTTAGHLGVVDRKVSKILADNGGLYLRKVIVERSLAIQKIAGSNLCQIASCR